MMLLDCDHIITAVSVTVDKDEDARLYGGANFIAVGRVDREKDVAII
jgi:hypothetical protein